MSSNMTRKFSLQKGKNPGFEEKWGFRWVWGCHLCLYLDRNSFLLTRCIHSLKFFPDTTEVDSAIFKKITKSIELLFFSFALSSMLNFGGEVGQCHDRNILEQSPDFSRRCSNFQIDKSVNVIIIRGKYFWAKISWPYLFKTWLLFIMWWQMRCHIGQKWLLTGYMMWKLNGRICGCLLVTWCDSSMVRYVVAYLSAAVVKAQ